MNYESMISANRIEKIKNLLAKKQSNLEIFMDNVHDSRNISAIIRSCDAVGVLNLYYTSFDDRAMKTNKLVTQGSHKWVEKTHIKHKDRLNFLKQKQANSYQIVATALEKDSISYSQIDYTKPTIIVLGNEKDGVNEDILKIADKKIIIPMVGMAQSLNVSVAAAIILFEAKRQREKAKMYDVMQLNKQEYEKIYNKWIKREGLLKRIKGRANIKN